jgi:nitroimidazol reductase NimA-like FMN-containing flavoprotein (pyridoxamine 5'-phosphate oxidase superfamily)
MEVDRNGLEVLNRDECLRLLGTATLGRIGFTSGALPVVLPVSFHLEGERILVRTDRGSKLDAALQNTVVAFEADEFDRIGHGWSVAVTGLATEVSEPTEVETVRQGPGVAKAAGGDEALVAISTEFLSGRRLTSASQAPRR